MTLPVVGARCRGGALTVERFLEQVPGVFRAYANDVTEMAYVEYDPQETDLRRLKEAIESAGYATALPEEGQE